MYPKYAAHYRVRSTLCGGRGLGAGGLPPAPGAGPRAVNGGKRGPDGPEPEVGLPQVGAGPQAPRPPVLAKK